MYQEYYADQGDPSVSKREGIRRDPDSIKELFLSAKKEDTNITMRQYLDDMGFDTSEVANLLKTIGW